MQSTFQSPWFTLLFGRTKHKLHLGTAHLEIDKILLFKRNQAIHRISYKEIDSIYIKQKKLFSEIYLKRKTGDKIILPNFDYRTAFELKCRLSGKL